MSVDRYTYAEIVRMKPSGESRWVGWHDHAAALAERDAEIERLRGLLLKAQLRMAQDYKHVDLRTEITLALGIDAALSPAKGNE